jgi:hypothetical protein
MSASQNTEGFDTQVRLSIYDHFIKMGQAPTMAEIARNFSATLSEVKMACQRLAKGRALVLQDGNGEILMAEPFSLMVGELHLGCHGYSCDAQKRCSHHHGMWRL